METKPIKAQRIRSPNFPSYDLRQCAGFLEKLYKKYGTSEVHVDDAIKQMGHSATSSTANRVLSSMLGFGLLDSRGTKEQKFVRPTRLAQKILLEKEGSPEQVKLLQEAALYDETIQEIFNKWGQTIPVEETIRKVLQLEMGYSPDGAKRFASVIGVTYDYAHLTEIIPEETSEPSSEKEFPESGPNYKPLTSTRKTNLLLPGSGREVQIDVPYDLTEAEFELLLKWLEFQKFGLVSKQIDRAIE